MQSGFKNFPELDELFACAEAAKIVGCVREEACISYGEHDFPILSFHFGSQDPSVPTLLFAAGVHGLEKIGTHVVTAYLRSFIRLLHWDKTLINTLEHCRVLFYPMANPVGMYLNRRSNGQGIDLMRNAPLEAEAKALFLIGGHRFGSWLPWYRGEESAAMEQEALTLCEFVRSHLFKAKTAIALDVHSGFGLIDRLWFPYAYTHRYYPHAGRVLALKKLLDQSYPHHVYRIEPQHHSYTTHGDIWDYLSLEQQNQPNHGVMVPFCLEMGSWHWIKKNPRQMFTSLGIFNPVLPHRVKRTERRHFFLFDFLIKAIVSGDRWANFEGQKKIFLEQKARQLWY